MSSGMQLRKRGARREGKAIRTDKSSPFASIDEAGVGEVKISVDAQMAHHHLYQSSPSLQAARSVLMGQLISSGIRLRRNGVDVELEDEFQRHLESHWINFARSVIDSFLVFGFCIVAIEDEPEAPFAKRRREPARPGRLQPQPVEQGRASKAPPMHKQQQPSLIELRNGANLVPIVPDVGTYELAWVVGGASGYKRQYRVYSTSPRRVYEEDLNAEVFFKTHPDQAGNMSSPVACVFDTASFVGALQELALNAETVRARQQLITQSQKQGATNNNLDPSNLFFDSESRAMHQSAEETDSAQAAGSLALMAKMAAIINQQQTTNRSDEPINQAVRRWAPPEQPPRLFACPEKQEVVTGLRPPEARSDLNELLRYCNESIAAAMGVPASVVFEGKFSSNSSKLRPLASKVSLHATADGAPRVCRSVATSTSEHDCQLPRAGNQCRADGRLQRHLQR